MTKTARKSLIKPVVALLVLLLAAVIATQFVTAPAFVAPPLRTTVSQSVNSDSLNGVGVTYKTADPSKINNEYLRSDNTVKEQTTGIATPSADKNVDVIISFDGIPMMQYANDNGMSVAKALSTAGGKANIGKLKSIRETALAGISGYIKERRITYTTVMNAISATVRYGDIAAIEKSSGVKNVIVSETYLAPQAVTENYVDVYQTGIFNSEGVGYDGTGTVVAVLDTGTDIFHEVFDMELDGSTLALTKDDVAAVVPELCALSSSAEKGEEIDEDDLYIRSKLPYAYDYADSDTNVFPREAHGTHVAGIIAGKSDTITGVAPSAQVATFKVFSDNNRGAKSEWIMAALNDAVTLGVDVINMSLGSSCGFSREVDEVIVNQVYDSINQAGICLVVAASNDASSAQGSTWGNTNLASNPDSGTVGSPGSYNASLSVGSVSGVKTKYFVAEGHEIYFAESRLMGKVDPNDFVGGLLGAKSEGEFEYVVIPGIGVAANYRDLDVEGKIAVVKRGSNSFEEKVRIAASYGAIGVIVYNNVSGTIGMSVGTKEVIPSCFVTMDYAEPIVASGSGKIKLSTAYLAGPFMSDFSSWGTLPNLILAPDITAHGGEIYSAVPGGKYDKLSGTSMAAPNLAGALILVCQYVKENNVNFKSTQVRDESYGRMMSTATIVKNEEGNPYSPRKQGAGIADISHSINTKAYLSVDGSNKPKLSLGDDPNRTGVYEMKFNIVNTSGSAVSYTLGQYVMTETMSSDERTVAEKAYMLNDTTNVYSLRQKKGTAVMRDNVISVSGYGEAEISATIALSSKDKEYINGLFVNGMFVEGYILLNSNNGDGIDLNIPFLAFYGDWAKAPMLDVTAYQVGESQVDDSVLEKDKLVADVYATLPYSGFYSPSSEDNLAYWGMGAYAFILPSGYETPATQEKYAALTNNSDGDYMFYMVSAGLLRGAKRVDMQIRNSATGELVWSGTDYNARKSRGSGGKQVGGFVMIELDMRNLALPNNSRYTFDMTCYLDWTGSNDYINDKTDPDLSKFVYGNKNTFSFEFTIDDESPEVSDISIRKVKNDLGYYNYQLELTAYDNHYLQGYAIYTYGSKDDKGYYQDTLSLTDGVIPADANFNANTTFNLDISGYWNAIQANNGKCYVVLYDYAKNTKVVELDLTASKMQKDDIRIEKSSNARDDYYIAKNAQLDLTEYMKIRANAFDSAQENEKQYLEGYLMKDLVWASSNPTLVDVTQQGIITALGDSGDAVITVRTPNVEAYDPADTSHCLSFNVHISGRPLDSVRLSGVELSATSFTIERGESVTITAAAKPLGYSGAYSLKWSSDNANVSLVVSDDNKSVTVTALKSGVANIRANVVGSYISGYCDIVVREEFEYYENVYLRSYTGRGGDYTKDGTTEHNVVDIPDDKGIVYIYPRAFVKNNYIKKVIIPEGVTTIMRLAFYDCPNLSEVVLPSTLETIEEAAFANCDNLKVINLKNVKSIGNSAFWFCKSLDNIDLTDCTYIDSFAFVGCTGLTSLDLKNVGMIGGGAFAMCTSLTSLVIPKNTSMAYDPYYWDLRKQMISGAFTGCTGLKSVTVYSDNIGKYAFFGCTGLTGVTFMNNVNTIEEYAFALCSGLTKIDFYGSAYKIGDGAFYNCNVLKSLRIPDGLTILGVEAFGKCDSITQITIASGALLDTVSYASLGGSKVSQFVVESGNKYVSAQSGVLYDRAQLRLIAYPRGKQSETFTAPESVKIIGKSAFSGVDKIKVYNLPNVAYIEEYAFADAKYRVNNSDGSTNIYTLTVSAPNLKTIGDSAFRGAALAALPIGSSVTYIGNYAFNLTSYPTSFSGNFVIPANIRYIGDYAFAGGVVTYTDKDGKRQEGTLPMPFTSISFASSPLTKVGKNAFEYNTNLTSINFGNLTEISDNMFAHCGEEVFENGVSKGFVGLSTVVIPNTIKNIGSGAFDNCRNLSQVTLPDNLEHISSYAFRHTAITTIMLPDSVRTIGDYAFAGATLQKLQYKNAQDQTVDGYNNVYKIGDYAFAYTAVTEVSSQNITSIGKGAYKGSNALVAVSLPKAELIDDSAFENCAAIVTLDISGAKNIGIAAFKGCNLVTSLQLAAAETIGDNAFEGCSAATTVSIPKAVTIGKEAFAGTGITEIELAKTVTKVADRAFYRMASLTSISVESGNATYIGTDDGVLYSVNAQGLYTLVSYPANKTNASYSVNKYTIKIGAYAFNGNTHLTSITLPPYVQVIADGAMKGMTSLESIYLNAIAAPSLESYAHMVYDDTPANPEPEQPADPDTPILPPDYDEIIGTGKDKVEVPDDEELPEGTYTNFYDNFNFANAFDGGKDSSLRIYIPYNCGGYDNRIWRSYVGKCIVVTDKIHASLWTLDFIGEVKQLVAQGANADKNRVNTLIRYYNMMLSDQQNFIIGNYDYKVEIKDANQTVIKTLVIDKAYYTELLGGVNYYEQLQNLAAGRQANVLAAGVVTSPQDSAISQNTDYIAAIFAMIAGLFAACIAVAVICRFVRSR